MIMADTQTTTQLTEDQRSALRTKIADGLQNRIGQMSPEDQESRNGYLGIYPNDDANVKKGKYQQVADDIIDKDKVTIHKSGGESTTYDIKTLVDWHILPADYKEQFLAQKENPSEMAADAEAQTRTAIRQKVADGLKEGLTGEDPKLNKEITRSLLGIKDINDDAGFVRVANELIDKGAVTVTKADGTTYAKPIEEFDSLFPLNENGKKFSEQVPDAEKIDKIARAVGKGVDENTNDATKGWGGGASFVNILMGLFEWFTGGMTGGLAGLKETIANTTANGIEASTRNNLKAEGLSDEDSIKIANETRKSALEKAGYVDKRPAEEMQTQSPATLNADAAKVEAPAQRSQNQPVAEKQQQNGVVTTVTEPAKAPAKDASEQLDNSTTVKTVAVAGGVGAAFFSKENDKQELTHHDNQLHFDSKSAKVTVDKIVKEIMGGANPENQAIISAEVLKTLETKQNSLKAGDYSSLSEDISNALLNNKQTLPLIIEGAKTKIEAEAEQNAKAINDASGSGFLGTIKNAAGQAMNSTDAEFKSQGFNVALKLGGEKLNTFIKENGLNEQISASLNANKTALAQSFVEPAHAPAAVTQPVQQAEQAKPEPTQPQTAEERAKAQALAGNTLKLKAEECNDTLSIVCQSIGNTKVASRYP